jgi:hypothetical protein
MRGYTQEGRFDASFEQKNLEDGIATELRTPIGSSVQWWLYDPVNSSVDPVYDTGSISYGLKWTGPNHLPVIRAIITEGKVTQSERGFYKVNDLHLTVLGQDLLKIDSGVLNNPDIENRARVVWHGQVFRPYYVQQRGIIGDTFSLVSVDLMQLSPEELINESQFASYAN